MSANARFCSRVWFRIPSVQTDCTYFVHTKTSHCLAPSVAVHPGPLPSLGGSGEGEELAVPRILSQVVSCVTLEGGRRAGEGMPLFPALRALAEGVVHEDER